MPSLRRFAYLVLCSFEDDRDLTDFDLEDFDDFDVLLGRLRRFGTQNRGIPA